MKVPTLLSALLLLSPAVLAHPAQDSAAVQLLERDAAVRLDERAEELWKRKGGGGGRGGGSSGGKGGTTSSGYVPDLFTWSEADAVVDIEGVGEERGGAQQTFSKRAALAVVAASRSLALQKRGSRPAEGCIVSRAVDLLEATYSSLVYRKTSTIWRWWYAESRTHGSLKSGHTIRSMEQSRPAERELAARREEVPWRLRERDLQRRAFVWIYGSKPSFRSWHVGSSSSSAGKGSSSSSTGGSTRTGSGVTPRFGGGRYYGGGATTPYSAGARSPLGIAPVLLGVGALSLLPGLWIYGAYSYPYSHPYTFRNASARANSSVTTRDTITDEGVNQTKPITCLCAQYQECGCDDNSNTTYLNELIGNGSYEALNLSLVQVSDVNGTSTILINGTLPNGTTSAGGTENANAATRMIMEASGFWVMLAMVGCTVLLS